MNRQQRSRIHLRKAVWLLLAVMAGPTLAQDPGEASAVFLADSQIHNVHGSGVKQTLGISDLASKVAQRPPELNLLAPYVLKELASRAVAETVNSDKGIVFFLGDGTNIGCTGEYDAFRAALQAGLGDGAEAPLVLMAHGNHDSYLMGTVNSYVPGRDIDDWRPATMASADLPVDESWWGAPQQPSSHNQNTWKHICYNPSSDSAPINKVQWLARYFKSLEASGLQMMPGAVTTDRARKFESRVAPGTMLAALGYQAKGQWTRPTIPGTGSAGEANLQSTYTSFVVQAVDLGDTRRVILVDTSVCENARGGIYFYGSNAGMNSCMGQAQLDVIREMVDGSAGKQLIFAGHFPLDEIDEKGSFETIMASHGPRWIYVSAHTHDPMTVRRHGIATEVNIGSTTDWPMEYNRVFFPVNGGVPLVWDRPLVLTKPVTYAPPEPYQRSEMCRHLDAAVKLAGADVGSLGTGWESPGTRSSYEACERDGWKRSGDTLAAAVRKIHDRMSDPHYRQRILEIAAAASLQEYTKNSGSFLDRID
jgi:hypothetical protein